MNRCTVGGRWTLSEVMTFVVGDVERECKVVTAPPLDVERMMLVEKRCRATVVNQADLVLVAAVVVDRGRLRDHRLRRVEREVASQISGRGHPELVGGLDEKKSGRSALAAVGDLAERAGLRDVDPVALAIAQRAELRLQKSGALVDKGQQIAVDVADEERHRFAAPRQQHLAVGVGEHQQRAARGVGRVAGFELAGEQVERPQGTHRAVCSRVVAAIDVGGAAGESAAPEFVVLQAVQVGVQAPGRSAFSQVNKGFHAVSHRQWPELKLRLVLLRDLSQS
jgi:hypothetical protein